MNTQSALTSPKYRVICTDNGNEYTLHFDNLQDARESRSQMNRHCDSTRLEVWAHGFDNQRQIATEFLLSEEAWAMTRSDARYAIACLILACLALYLAIN